MLLLFIAGGLWLHFRQPPLPKPDPQAPAAQGPPRSPTNRVTPRVAGTNEVPSISVARVTTPPPVRVGAPLGASTSAPPLTNFPALPAKTNNGAVRGDALLRAQVALDRAGISPGSIDGLIGSQTRSALRAFQARERIPVTGLLDDATQPLLVASCEEPLMRYIVDGQEAGRLAPVPATWLGKSQSGQLFHQSLLEMLGERSHAHPNLLRRLNPGVAWTNVAPGTAILMPRAERERPSGKAAYLRIALGERVLQAFDASERLLAHFPCSIASRVEKRPVGELRVTVIALNPNYTFDPKVFPESREARELGRKLILPPGPNNPVGTVWIGLDKPGYGIHGTPRPEDVGRTESHGCFRLANWNAEHLVGLVAPGTPVRVVP